MSVHDDLGNRMKEYERRNQHYLQKKIPVAIRIDMRCGHSFTKGLNRPFDEIFATSMQKTMTRLCQEIQNAIFVYTQSDEITIILTDYATIKTDAWFDYRIEKICSVTASMATLYFNQEFQKLASKWSEEYFDAWHTTEEEDKYFETLNACLDRGAMFDARCFNVPQDEVINLIYWRQVDAIRNSINMWGQAFFSHKELMNKNTREVREMLEERGIQWENIPVEQQRGVACYKGESGWIIDKEMPVLKGEGRSYLEEIMEINNG